MTGCLRLVKFSLFVFVVVGKQTQQGEVTPCPTLRHIWERHQISLSLPGFLLQGESSSLFSLGFSVGGCGSGVERSFRMPRVDGSILLLDHMSKYFLPRFGQTIELACWCIKLHVWSFLSFPKNRSSFSHFILDLLSLASNNISIWTVSIFV